MSHHHDHDHSHSHHHDDHDHDHNHDHSDDIEPALQTLLWKQIDFEGIRTLNESETDSGAKCVEKTWNMRMDPEPYLESDADEQLLMFVPFTGVVRLHSILIRSSPHPSAPRTLKIFHNRDDLDFASASELQPTQTLQLSQTAEVQEIPVKRAAFGNVYTLSLFFEDNFGGEGGEGEGEVMTRLWWIGFKGEFMRLSREPVEVLYEKAANPRDHVLVQGVGDAAGAGGMGERHGM
ncbi:MAG: hypothetical protein LQ350_006187 [Teloschistes chrysophthalmus]|nr:MAG: hypothetical protein LQ350_006187 [Niorma chrysophthalma]